MNPTKKTIVVAVVIALVSGLPAFANDARKSSADSWIPAQVHQGGLPDRVVGTVQYDNDTPFRRLPNTDAFVGNRFDTGFGNPHSLATMTFRLAQNYGGGVVITAWDVNPPNASVLLRTYISGLPSTTVTGFTFTVPLGNINRSGSFLLGVHNTFYTGLGCPTNSNLNGTCDGVALTAGTPGAAPFHGVTIPLAGGAFSPPTTFVNSTGNDLGTANAIVRATGDNLPVELMKIDVD
jgi:hypothetical protein